ncbi:hypothetical protein GGP55_003317 [Salinibacter ruber]|uniref:hypothetical protein n=1 Tax=Salinibacter ruber TaxID=146919 RepID=UPI0021687D93|nr:hypothetical protein [Salinibacter ruber]MCS3632695.1 hypothetical protein [Salinibacter ruber]
MCLGSGEAHPQRVAAESFEEDHLNRGGNRAADRELAFSLFITVSFFLMAPLLPAESISSLEGVSLPAPIFPIRQALRSILTVRPVLAARPVLAGCRATGIQVAVRTGHVTGTEAVA